MITVTVVLPEDEKPSVPSDARAGTESDAAAIAAQIRVADFTSRLLKMRAGIRRSFQDLIVVAG
jgi:hypothetical protein